MPGSTKKKMVLLFPNPDNQFVCSQVEEDVAFGPENMGLAPPVIKARVDQALKMVSMEDYRYYSLQMLSGGQKQKAAIAGLLAMKPEYMVWDEPTSMLDPRGQKEVIQALVRLRQQEGLTIILVTHNLEEAINADQVIVLHEGSLALQGTPAEIFSRPDRLKAAGLEAPGISRLIAALNVQLPWTVPADFLKTEDLVEELCRLRLKI